MRAAFCAIMVVASAPGMAHAQLSRSSMDAAVTRALPIVRDAYTFLHSNPELGKAEFKAHDYISAKLREMGYSEFVSVPSLPTAVIAILDSGHPGPTIALRAEMDARPLPDGTDEPASHSPRSQVKGVMHNCGHDAHAAILLGTAAVLKRNAGQLRGRIVFVFQPAEETAGGADDIVKDGVLDRLHVSRIFAEHSAPGMSVGMIGVTPGDTLAGSNYFKLKLSGRSSHAAAPFDGDDVALGAMKVAQEISELPARHLDISTRPAVISITSFVASSGASNVLPATVEINGTLRAYEDPDRAPADGMSLKEIITARVAAVSAAYGLTPTWEQFRTASPPTRNDRQLFDETLPLLSRRFPGAIDTSTARSMFSEDFAYYTNRIPSLYFSLGVAKGELGKGGVHSADFTISPEAFRYGVQLMSELALLAGSTSGSSTDRPIPPPS